MPKPIVNLADVAMKTAAKGTRYASQARMPDPWPAYPLPPNTRLGWKEP